MTQIMITVAKRPDGIELAMTTETGETLCGIMSPEEVQQVVDLLSHPVAAEHPLWDDENKSAIYVQAN